MKEKKRALIVIDMIDQFVHGEWANPRAQAIVSNVVALVDKIKAEGGIVVTARDAHNPGDPEERAFPPHAMAGTKGSEIIPELSGKADFDIPKKTYNAFFRTALGSILANQDVDEVILAGVLTNICVRHTAADAFFRGYPITIAADTVEVLPGEGADDLQTRELENMKVLYATQIVDSWEEV